MSQILTIVDDVVVIDKLALKSTTGTVVHTGSLTVRGGDVAVDTLSANTINVKQLITDNGALDAVGDWKYGTEIELNGKGFTWATPDRDTKLIFRTGNRLWTNANLDLTEDAVYSIGDTPVLTADSLGDNVVNSQLTSVGTLRSLDVTGDVVLGEFAYINSSYNRVGLGTDEPNSALSILENNVEIVIGVPTQNTAAIGTYTSHDVSIVSDNIPRITAKANGEVVIGDEVGKTGVLRVYGTIYAETLQTDNRVTRTHPLEFKATAETSVYGLGMLWSGTGSPKQLVMAAGPDRIWSSEDLAVDNNKSFYVGDANVLSATTLGQSVVHSNLQTVGELTSLTVAGNVSFRGNVTLDTITANHITFGNVSLGTDGINTTNTLTLSANSSTVVYADNAQVTIGDHTRRDKPVKVFGPLSVNVNNPDPSLNFSVSGDVNIGGKRFTNGMSFPTAGAFELGDICWNSNPHATSYIGWVCVVAGDPGQWLPFGGISPQ